jgi:hypothetical protein
VKIVLIMEIVLFIAAFMALHRALRRRVDEAVRWEVSVTSQIDRSTRRLPPRTRPRSDDDPAPDRLGGYSAVMPAEAGMQ